jgi:hypothetical protein|tara:strand:- start:713 stop:1657 length:945 start_codon:yes stop_codon:yes gene_type:complete
MAVTATVTPGKVFGDADVITKETLNQLGQPTVTIAGSVGSLALADGSVTGTKIAGDAAIQLTKLEDIPRGKIIVGNSSADGAIVDANDSGKILVGDGTDLNSVAVTGDVSLAASGAVTINSGAVEAGMLDSGIVVTDGGLEKVVAGIQIKNDGIDPLTKITGHADRIGQLISYDDSGDPEYVDKGTEGQILRADSDGLPKFVLKYKAVDMGTLPTTDSVFSATNHELGYTPTHASWYIEKVTSGTDSVTGYSQYDRIVGSYYAEDIRLWMNATQVGGYLNETDTGFNIRKKTDGTDLGSSSYTASDFKFFIVVG